MMDSFAEMANMVLSVYRDGKTRHIFGVIKHNLPDTPEPDIQRLLIEYMESHDLVHPAEHGFSEYEYAITPFGYEIVSAGGWVAHLAALEALEAMKENRQNEITELGEKNERSQRRIQRLQLYVQIVGVIAAFLAAGGTILGVYLSNKTATLERQIDKVTKQKDSLEKMTIDQSHSLETKERQIEKLTLKIDSLVN